MAPISWEDQAVLLQVAEASLWAVLMLAVLMLAAVEFLWEVWEVPSR